MEKKPTKFYSTKQEQAIADYLGWSAVPASGARSFDIWKCLLVQQRGRMDGVLVMPKAGRCVGWAAYVDFGAGE